MKHFLRDLLKILCIFLLFIATIHAQPLSHKNEFTRQDTLRGSIGLGRMWWDVQRYDISLKVNIPDSSLSGYNDISYKVIQSSKGLMQIDLQAPMQIDKIQLSEKGRNIPFTREGNVYWVQLQTPVVGQVNKLRIYFSGKPKTAVRPPWDGGWIWTKDEKNRDWVSTATQGLGASCWLPCKDHQSDEPDKGISFTITVPNGLVAVSNGRFDGVIKNHDSTSSWKWKVVNPINTYLITPYIGHYTHFEDTLQGEKGKLDMSYWVLDYNLEKAKKHFDIVKPMLHCFEYWMGPYPFYEDSYKLVDAPHLGMEHQSAVAYGNKYLNGYLGKDMSGTGWGKDWDYIVVHESGHEWFANNITTKDIADMWVHESFTTYTETFFVQCRHGLQAANEYCIGERQHIANDIPIIGLYGVNKEGSGDMYAKGANMIHTIRQVINNDDLFRKIIRGLNKDFYHQTVTTEQIENYIGSKSGKDLKKIFGQYLRTTKIPVLEYTHNGKLLSYKWTNCIKGFNMPVQLQNGKWLQPTENAKSITVAEAGSEDIIINPNFYIVVKKAS